MFCESVRARLTVKVLVLRVGQCKPHKIIDLDNSQTMWCECESAEAQDESIDAQYINKGMGLSVFTKGAAGVKNRSELSSL